MTTAESRNILLRFWHLLLHIGDYYYYSLHTREYTLFGLFLLLPAVLLLQR